MGDVCSKVCALLFGNDRPPPQEGMTLEMTHPGARTVYASQGVPLVQGASMPMAQGMVVTQGMPMAQGMAPGMVVSQGMPMAQGMAPGMCAQGFTAPMAQAYPVAQAMPLAQGFPTAQGMYTQAVPTAQAAEATQVRTKLPGRRRSLLVGINYFGTSAELSGCIADVKRIVPMLESQGFPSESQNQIVLIDEPGRAPHLQPTLASMRRAIAWLVEGAQTGDALFFHYSGHGGREESDSGADGFVETLCPVDYETSGQLLDLELFEILVRSLPSGCRLTCLMDCCHSGGVLNLPYLFTGTEDNLKRALAGQMTQLAMSQNWLSDFKSFQDGDPSALLSDFASMGLGLWSMWGQHKASKDSNSAGFATDEYQNIGVAVGEVIAITGCRSDQTSADVGDVHENFNVKSFGDRRASLNYNPRRSVRNAAGGALTSVFIESLQAQAAESLSYLSLLERIRTRLAEENYEQVPQLATSLLIELRQSFSLDTISLPANPNSPATQNAGRSAGMEPKMGMASAGVLSGFMASMAMAPMGKTMLSSAQRDDGFTPYAGFMERHGSDDGLDFAELAHAFQSTSFLADVVETGFAPDTFASEPEFVDGSFQESCVSDEDEDEEDEDEEDEDYAFG